MKKYIAIAAVVLALATVCLAFAGCVRTQNAADMVTLNQLTGDFNVPILVAELNLDGTKVRFEYTTVATVNGVDTEDSGKVSNGEFFSWIPDQDNIDADQAFVAKIIATDQSNIVGYAVVSANFSGGKLTYKVVEAKRFPQVNGGYQEITEEYVQECIEKAAKRA